MELAQLRSQVFVAGTPTDGLVARPIGVLLVEIAMWDRERAARRDDPELAGIDDETVLMRARTQAVIATTDSIKFVPVTIGGLSAEIAATTEPYLGACMLEALAHADPAALHLVVPVSWHHWILHAVTDETDDDVMVAGLAELARAIVEQTEVAAAERLLDAALWWPGNGLPAKMRPWR